MGQMLSPEFGDLDGDGDIDLLVGDFNGFIKFYENVTNGNDLTFSFRENVENIDKGWKKDKKWWKLIGGGLFGNPKVISLTRGPGPIIPGTRKNIYQDSKMNIP